MSNRVFAIAAILTLTLMQVTTAMGAAITVDDDGPADFQSIQAAINAANEGDAIQVTAGTYVEHVKINKDNITLRGEDRGVTTIKYGGKEKATISVEKVTGGVISGFTVKNTKSMMPGEDYPIGIHLIDAVFTVRDSAIVVKQGALMEGIKVEGGQTTIRNNLIESQIYGIRISEQAAATIENNQILNNGMYGIEVKDAQAEIRHNQILGGHKDGISFSDNSQGTILYNIIHDNKGDGLRCINSSPEIRHNTIVGNSGKGIYFEGDTASSIVDNIIVDNEYGIHGAEQLSLIFAHNDVWGNDDDYFNCEPGATDIAVEPVFVDVDEDDFRFYEISPLVGAASDGRNIGAIVDETVPLAQAEGIVSVSVAGSPAGAQERITVSMFGKSGAIAHFSIGGIVEDVPMTEVKTYEYQGEYTVKWGDVAYNQPVIVKLLTDGNPPYPPLGKGSYEKKGPKKVSLDGTPIQSIQIEGSPVHFGQPIAVTINGMPNGSATFTVSGNEAELPMAEVSTGEYQGTYRVRWEDAVGNHYVTARLTAGGYADEENERFEVVRGALTSVAIDGSPAKAGDKLIIEVTGKSGASVTADIAGINGEIPLTEEIPDLPGVYQGMHEVRPGENVSEARVTIHFTHDGNPPFGKGGQGGFGSLEKVEVEVQANQRVTIDTVKPTITKVQIDPSTQNGHTINITLNSEAGAFVTADLSRLDTTLGMAFIPEIPPGKYSQKITISHDNIAINGMKIVDLMVKDAAGNETRESPEVELKNPIAETQELLISGQVNVPDGILSGEAMVVIYNATAKSEMKAPITDDGRYSVTFADSQEPVAEIGTLIQLSIIDDLETKATASHYVSQAEIDNGKATVDVAIIANQMRLTVEPKTLPADGHSKALIEIRLFRLDGMESAPSPALSATTGAIGKLYHDESMDMATACYTATYTAGTTPGNVILTASDGDISTTANILLTPEIKPVADILIKGLSSRVLLGKTVRITGMITPPLSFAPITLEVIAPTNFSWLEHTHARSDGAFNFGIRLDAPGAWHFRAFHRHASSSIVKVDVEAEPYTAYVGSQWRTYIDADGLGDNAVEFLLEDSRGTIWAATMSGVSKLVGETWKRLDFYNHVTYLLEDSRGAIWAATRGGGVIKIEGEMWKRYTTEHGLGGNRVERLFEDSRGAMWAATLHDGISKLEGETWKNYTTDHGLEHDYATSLLEDSRGTIWASTWGGGVSRLEGERWRTYTADEGLGDKYVKYLLADSDGTIWTANQHGGVSKFAAKRWQTYTTAHGLGHNDVNFLLEDSRGNLWAATQGGVGKLTGEGWETYTKIDGLRSNHVKYLFEDSRGAMWAATEGGVSKFLGERWQTYTTVNGLGSDDIKYLLEDSHGAIWAVTNGAGVSRLKRDAWRMYTTADDLGDTDVKYLLADSHGTIWAGTANGGVSRLEEDRWRPYTTANGLGGNAVESLLEDRYRNLWAATEGGVSRLKVTEPAPSGERWENYTTADGLGSNSIDCFLKDSRGNLWAGTWGGGVSRFTGQTWETYTDVHGLGDNRVNFLLEDSRGDIWAATGYGEISKLIGDNSWEAYPIADELKHSMVGSLLEDSRGNLWVTTEGGVGKLAGERWQAYTTADGLGDNYVRYLLEDSFDDIWTATDRGVSKLVGGRWRTYTTAHGLGHNHVKYLFEDSHGNLWAATMDGISRFVRNLDCWSSPFARISCNQIIEDHQGVLWIATEDKGVVRYEPGAISPQTIITTGPVGVVGESLVHFEYLGADLDTDRGDLLYAWKLDDSPWSAFTPSTFMGVPVADGVHTFYVRASDNEGNLDYTPAKRTFRVDTTRPIAVIEKPAPNEVIGGKYQIIGVATDETDFEEYAITIKPESGEEVVQGFPRIVRHKVGKLSDGGLLATWDTTAQPDGVYTIDLIVRDKKDGNDDIQHTKTDSVTVAVDNTLPTAEKPSVKDKTPDDGQLTGIIQISIQISDTHIAEYTAECIQNNRVKWGKTEKVFESGRLERNFDSSAIYGEVTIRLTARDLAGNTSLPAEEKVTLKNEGAKPIARLETPRENDVIAGTLEIKGEAKSVRNFKSYVVKYAPGHKPSEGSWDDIRKGSSPSNEKLATWDTTRLTDGEYSVQLTVTDENDAETKQVVHIVIDNTKPVIELTSPANNAIKSDDVSIAGTVRDDNFWKYEIKYAAWNAKPELLESTGLVQDEDWKPLEMAGHDNSIKEVWETEGRNGLYLIRITATDKAIPPNQRHLDRMITLDNTSAEAAITSPKDGQFYKEVIDITGTANDDNFGDYQLFWGAGEKPSEWNPITAKQTTPVTNGVLGSWETAGRNGVHQIKLEVHDQSDRAPTLAAVTIFVDNTPPTVEITTPRNEEQVEDEVELKVIIADAKLKEYAVAYRGEGIEPQNWTEDFAKPKPINEAVENELLYRWKAKATEGRFTLKLTVRDDVGHENTAAVTVNIIPPISRNRGGKATSEDGNVSLYIPPRSLPKDTIVTINPVHTDDIKLSPDNARSLHRTYDIKPPEVKLRAIKPATLQIKLALERSEGLAGISGQKERRLAFFRWDERWIFLGGTVQEDNFTIGITQFGCYALMALEKGFEPAGLDSLFTCQPRVFSPEREKATISFSLPKDALVTLKIYTLDGRLQRTLVAAETMRVGRKAIMWDGRDENDQVVPSGLYLIALEIGDGKVNTKAIVIQNR